MNKFDKTFFPTRINNYFFLGALLLFFLLNYIGVSFFNDIDTQDSKPSRTRGAHAIFYHHK